MSHIKNLWEALTAPVPLVDVAPHHHHQDVDEVDREEANGVREADLLRVEDVEGPEAGHEVEADVPEERPLHRVEGPGEGHRASHAGRDKHPRPEQRPEHQLREILPVSRIILKYSYQGYNYLAYSSQGGEDIGCAVTQGQKGHSGDILRQSNNLWWHETYYLCFLVFVYLINLVRTSIEGQK